MPPSSPVLRLPAVRWVWFVWLGLVLLLALTTLSLLRYGHIDSGPRWGLRGLNVFHALAYATVAVLILARHPWHRVGLLMLWAGGGSALQSALEEYAIVGLLVAPGRLPGALFAAWVANWIWLPANGAVAVLLPLLFPAGRLPSPRWRGVVGLGLLGLTIAVIGFAVTPGPFGSSLSFFTNPYGLTRWGDRSVGVANLLAYGGLLVLLAAIVLSALAVLRRLRWSVGVERQQLKWFVVAVAVAAALTPLTASELPVLHILYLAASTALPVAIGVAVLRYRLYDIDLLVNRTLVYGALTAILAGVYFGSVVLLQNLFATLTGESRSALVTVLSTLAIAALFTPARACVQVFIDQRFYRRKYDAVRTLAAFGATLRDEVDLTALSGRLVGVVDETMQPATAVLWLKPPPHA